MIGERVQFSNILFVTCSCYVAEMVDLEPSSVPITMRCSRVLYEIMTGYIFLSKYILDKVNSIPGISFVVRLPARSSGTKPGFL